MSSSLMSENTKIRYSLLSLDPITKEQGHTINYATLVFVATRHCVKSPQVRRKTCIIDVNRYRYSTKLLLVVSKLKKKDGGSAFVSYVLVKLI